MLSQLILIFSEFRDNSTNNCLSLTASFTALVKAIYSASVEESETVFCIALFQETVQLLYLNTLAEFDFLSSKENLNT